MAELVDYRISYGECVGYCTSVLTLRGLELELIQTSNAGESFRQFRGIIDEHLARRIRRAVANVPVGRLLDVYGNPDARDEGTVTVRLRGSAGITEHSYSRGQPPGELTVLDALVRPIVFGWIDGNALEGVRYDTSP